ncbi:hypothetical protein F4808DRAFT_440506 [Astrocystis sublimbata]|nr:hypothetical protein F4808DRAFT_440506 [Astrocystis sublimbata]
MVLKTLVLLGPLDPASGYSVLRTRKCRGYRHIHLGIRYYVNTLVARVTLLDADWGECNTWHALLLELLVLHTL